MGTVFAAATRDTGGELQFMSRTGYDATTFGNHEFDLGPTAWATPSAWPARRPDSPFSLKGDLVVLSGLEEITQRAIDSMDQLQRGRIERFLPGLAAPARYDRAWLRSDLLAGTSVAAVAVPIAIAYSQLAGVPPAPAGGLGSASCLNVQG